jgi:hypothetical protein
MQNAGGCITRDGQVGSERLACINLLVSPWTLVNKRGGGVGVCTPGGTKEGVGWVRKTLLCMAAVDQTRAHRLVINLGEQVTGWDLPALQQATRKDCQDLRSEC